jgi:hypothetical protein
LSRQIGTMCGIQPTDLAEEAIYYPRDIIYCLFKGIRWSSGLRFYKLPLIMKRGYRAQIRIGNKFVACSDPREIRLEYFRKSFLKQRQITLVYV